MSKSIAHSIRRSMIGYTLLIVVLLWFFQIVFLNTYYQSMKKSGIVKAGKQISSALSQDDFEDYLEKTAFSNQVCVLVLDEHGDQIYSMDMLGRGCMIHSKNKETQKKLMEIIAPVLEGKKDQVTEFVRQPPFRDNAIIYASSALDRDGKHCVVLLNGFISPVRATQEILKSQIWIIGFILLVVSFLLSWYLSRRLSKPVEEITDSAKKLAKGDYTADFSGDGIEELDRLAETLNFAADGLSRVEDLRRELVANVSHDLKTPLTMIKAYAEMIRDLTGDDQKKREEQLNIIISETDRLTALVSDLIRVSRDEEQAKSYKPERFSLQDALRDVVDRFSKLYPDYRLSLDCGEEFPVCADRGSIAQVIYNLISNAINYTGEDKKVNVTARREDNLVRVEVVDTGIGIPKEEIPLIWERYYRSKNNHQRPIAGSGLGLSIVRNALAGQNLAYGVKSEPGNGSAFWFVLPVSEA